MTPFYAPTEELLFSLREVAGAARLSAWDDELSEEIVQHFAQFAEGVLAPINASGDAQGCRLEDGRVLMPDGFSEAYQQLIEGGWQGLGAPEEYGGMAVNTAVAAAVSEIFSGANHALQMVCNLVPGAISTLLRFGSEQQQSKWIPRLCSGELLSTMCLTEPGAGSDLSGIRTKAVRHENGWLIQGEKIFISGGDQNLSSGSLHLVLARTGAADSGVRGLSLFLCPSEINGSENHISITRIEEKLGLHASPTCQMVFEGAYAELVGEQGAGLAAMFTQMNHARLDVSLQGVAHASRAHQIALAYASERKQGRRGDGVAAVLSDHADVRRMLAEQRILARGSRAISHITLVEMALGERAALIDFLTPLCKIFCTEAGIRAADLGIQILGGYGYLEEYEISQVWRDARITAIYEGANGIHALSLATRGLRLNKGAGADAFLAFVRTLAQDSGEVMALCDTWQDARTVVEESDNAAAIAHEFALLSQELLLRAVWVKIAHAAATSACAEEYKLLEKMVHARPLPVRLPLAAVL